MYFLSLVGKALQFLEIKSDDATAVRAALLQAGLLTESPEWSLSKMLKTALDYLRRVELAGEMKIDPLTGTFGSVGGKITLREPGAEEEKHGFISADSLLDQANKAFARKSIRFWIVLDRLDVAFADSEGLERNALRALFRVYRDMQGLNNVSVKILLRDDIWARITDVGFREASHITRAITITWESRAPLNLVIRRALHNDQLKAYYGVEADKVLGSVQEQEKLCYRIFPPQVDAGARKSTTLDWMLSRTADGTKQTAPRELIHLLSAARDEQLRLLEMGAPEPARRDTHWPGRAEGCATNRIQSPIQPNSLCRTPDAQAIDDEARRRKNAAGCSFACEDMERIRDGRLIKCGKAVRDRFFREEEDEGATNLLGTIPLSRRATPGAGSSGVRE